MGSKGMWNTRWYPLSLLLFIVFCIDCFFHCLLHLIAYFALMASFIYLWVFFCFVRTCQNGCYLNTEWMNVIRCHEWTKVDPRTDGGIHRRALTMILVTTMIERYVSSIYFIFVTIFMTYSLILVAWIRAEFQIFM